MFNTILTRGCPARAPCNRGARALLTGIKREDWRSHPQVSRKLGHELAMRGEVAYWVVAAEARGGETKRVEQRGRARERIRLRSAKLLDGRYRFICECRICDRSSRGLRLELVRNIGVPARLSVYIDETGEVWNAKVVWRRGPVVGVRLYDAAPGAALRPSDQFALKERYYAVLD